MYLSLNVLDGGTFFDGSTFWKSATVVDIGKLVPREHFSVNVLDGSTFLKTPNRIYRWHFLEKCYRQGHKPWPEKCYRRAPCAEKCYRQIISPRCRR